MASILCVHGIGQQLKGEELIAKDWGASLRDGMRVAGANSEDLPGDEEIAVTFYGDLFREDGAKGFYPPFQLADIYDRMETDLVEAWLHEAETNSRADEAQGHDVGLKSGWGRETVQQMAVTLLRDRFFAALTERLFVGELKQVRRYFTESETRKSVRRRLAARLSADTRIVIAHSLGSIVAYEALSADAGMGNPAFITLGSPLGLPNLIFHRLDPMPVDGKGIWPGDVRSWTNIADRHDIVAAVKDLAPLFDGVRDVRVANEAQAHDASPYLTAKETGAAVLEALRG